jgi:hypothetical protein
MEKYKWDSSYEWLIEKVQKTDDVTELKSILFEIIPKIDVDEIQFIFQNEMDEDGYFDKIEE